VCDHCARQNKLKKAKIQKVNRKERGYPLYTVLKPKQACYTCGVELGGNKLYCHKCKRKKKNARARDKFPEWYRKPGVKERRAKQWNNWYRANKEKRNEYERNRYKIDKEYKIWRIKYHQIDERLKDLEDKTKEIQ
jgi:hypothetical protein